MAMSSLGTLKREAIFARGEERVILKTWELGRGQIWQEYRSSDQRSYIRTPGTQGKKGLLELKYRGLENRNIH